MIQTTSTAVRQIDLLLPHALPLPAQWAVGQLRDALVQRGWTVVDASAHPGEWSVRIALGPDKTPGLPPAPEALLISRPAPRRLLIAGSDVRGLVYALTDAAEAVALGATDDDPFAAVEPVAESPQLAWRSVQIFFGNADLEAGWSFDPAFWDRYLGELVRCRYNNLSPTFCHQTSYLAPPYPFHVDLPEYPQVRTPGFTGDDRRRHLQRLRMISDLAQQRGLHFTLGIWQQHDNGYGKPMVEGLAEDIRADANALGLQRMLEACPGIDGLQLRMNYEAGVPEDRQTEYWTRQFQAVLAVGRPIRVDLRAKGMNDQTIELARRMLPDVVVSTKFWCEHLGMPYAMPAIQQFDVPHYRRYGSWDLLRHDRGFDLIYRLWSFGSQRVLQWGDEQYVRRFARSCRWGSAGFEVMAPLTNKGGRNAAGGDWRLIADRAVQPFADEHERYWRFYRLFGRLGYRADASPSAWRRQMQARFGSAANAVDDAFNAAGGVLPLITTVMQFSASAWGYWPELFAGRTLNEDARIEPSDPTQFYGVDEYVAAALQGRLDGRWTPHHIAEHLHLLARRTRDALQPVAGADNPELRGAALDLLVTADLADFHACRLVAMTQAAVFHRTRCPNRLHRAIAAMTEAREHWRSLSSRTDGVYRDDLVFGLPDRQHTGHWKDRLAGVDADLHFLHNLRDQIADILPPDDDADLPGEDARPGIPDLACEHAGAGPLVVRLREKQATRIARAVCHHRRSLQTLPFQTLPMQRESDGQFVAVIDPAALSRRFDHMLMFEIHLADGQALRWPDWRDGDPYLVVPTS